MDIEPCDTSALDLEEALPMQRVFWGLEWALFLLIVLVMAASLAGLFGEGWLSETEAVDGDLAVRYERFVRLDKTTILTVSTTAPEVAIPGDYFRDFALERIVPAPSAQRTVHGDFVFEVDNDGGRYTLQFFLTPMNPLGTTSFKVGSGAAELDLSQFTFP
jgi:hypothetical protein